MPSSTDLTHDPSTSAWRKQMDDDPLSALQRLKVPALFIFGGADPWIPVGDSIALLRNFAKNHANIQYAVIDGVGHTMKIHPHEAMEVSKAALAADVPQSPAYFMLLGSWLARHAQ
jgi:pimeloyl-ACP methyl ester carboxylesterase